MTFPNPEGLTPLVDADEGDGTDVAPSEGGSLRARYEDALETIKVLEAERDGTTATNETLTEDLAYAAAGIDQDSGIGKAVKLSYDGPLVPDAIRDYAFDEFGWNGPVNEKAMAIANSHARLDNLSGSAGSIAPPSRADEQTAAERRGDTDTSIAMKSAQLGELLRP